MWVRNGEDSTTLRAQMIWKIVAWISTAAAAWAARQATAVVWSQVSDTEGPVNPADRSASWTEAFSWAVVAGLAAALARVLARRGAAAAYESVTGETPPGIAAA